MQVFSETTHSSQTKLLGQSLCVSEHLNLAFTANKGVIQKPCEQDFGHLPPLSLVYSLTLIR